MAYDREMLKKTQGGGGMLCCCGGGASGVDREAIDATMLA